VKDIIKVKTMCYYVIMYNRKWSLFVYSWQTKPATLYQHRIQMTWSILGALFEKKIRIQSKF